MGDFVGSVLKDALAHVIAGGVVFGITVLCARLLSSDPRYEKYRVPLFALICLAINVIYRVYFSRSWIAFLIGTLVVLGWVIFESFRRFWSLGIVGADRQTKSGVNYAKALSMCTSSLEFLGIGAGKLREQQQFEAAIDRCSRADRSIRFLLCNPDNFGLREIAQSAKRNPDDFRKVVLESLRALASLKRDRSKNIQVRLYKEFPVFRLMFIDDEICLVSHYILGKGGDGSDAPQLHLVRPRGSRDVESLYYGFHSYFDRIWQSSEEWDFKSFV